MISLLIYIKHHFGGFWTVVERLNGWLFRVLYHDLPRRVTEVLAGCRSRDFAFSEVTSEDIDGLGAFRRNQTTRYLSYFDPHPFDGETLQRLLRNRSFAMMKITDRSSGRIVGYFFLRCFFIGKAFHGLIVDEHYTNRGLGTVMWRLSADICERVGLRMYATVSEQNKASLVSAKKATDVVVVDRLKNGYMLIECRPKR